MKKLIIIPAYNESENIVKTVEAIKRDASEFDYIIINDCSKDDTLKICRTYNYNVVALPINLGIGGAVREDICMQKKMDMILQYKWMEMDNMIRLF